MEINNWKAKGILNLGEVDVQSVLSKLKELTTDDWDTEEDFYVNYNKGKKALSHTKHITLKFSDKKKKPYQYKTLSRWNNWEPYLLPLMEEIVNYYNYENGCFPRVMLANLPPKGFIAPHTDGDESGSIPHKIHIPLQSNEESFFFLEEQKFHLKVGSAYEVNNSIKHAVANGGKTERIHLIFEYLDFDAQTNIIQQQIKTGETD